MCIIRRHFRYNNIAMRQIGLFLLITGFLFTGQPGYTIEISDSPMATQIQKAPPNIMFVIDNSGSMDWSFMVAGASQGVWITQSGNARYYVFDNPGDNQYGGVLIGSERAEWQSQWSGSNKVYYNPQVNYRPWPLPDQDPATEGIDRMDNADPDNPISNPYFLIDGDASNDNIALDMTDVYYTVPEETNGIIVDNQDGSPAFTTVGGWYESGLVPEWNSSSFYTVSSGNTAMFTPNIPEDGLYDVYAWWNCYSNRDSNAMITVVHNGPTSPDTVYMTQDSTANDTPEPGVCGEWIPVGTYDFLAGTTGSVTIERHAGSTGGSTVADAINFVPTGLPLTTTGIDIYNAHYYAQEWNDIDSDGIKDSGELTNYLVNFNNGVRDVYQINDLNDNNAIDNTDELILVGHELPESIRPAIYDDEGNFIEYRDPANELQNFANWYSYYRRRELSSKAAMASVIVDSTGIQVGFYSLHDHNGGVTRQPVLPVRVPGQTDQTSTLLTHLYMMDSNWGTPLRTSLQNVGRYFDDTDGMDGGLGASPYYDVDEGGGCQHSFAIVMTDGFWNGDSPGVGNVDGDNGEPYEDNVSDTLADVAMYYYDRDLSSSLPNEVPSKDMACDQNSRQHMVTFSVSFGLNGTIDIEDINDNGIQDVDEDFDGENGADGLSYKTDPCFQNENTPRPDWPAPVANLPSTIDDLWHAAVNGRGEFFSASDPEELVSALIAIFQQVQDVNASEAAFTIDGDVVSSNTKVFGPSYDSATWTGEVKAIEFDEEGNLPYDDEGNIPDSEILWRASEQLMSLVGEGGANHSDRKIITMTDATNEGVPFQWSNISTSQQALLEGSEDVLEYIRGKNNIPGFRTRINNDLTTENILGDIVHSSPVLAGETIFIGANDGMLHAFNANDGTERFAYIPNLVFDNLAGLKETTFVHKFFVDATPAVWPIKDSSNDLTLLVGGLGKGGKGYFALDVTNADDAGAKTESQIADSIVMWEFPSPGVTDDDMGFSFSKPFIVKSNATGLSTTDGWVVIFGNGYNSTNEHAVLYIIDAVTGAEVAKLDTSEGNDNGLSTPALIDLNNDYKVDVVYAGDLRGNLWKFDLRDSSPGNWDVAFSGNALFTATGPTSNVNPQPITTKPAVMKHPLRHGLMVLFGTGKFFGESDRTNTDIQTLYGIWDFGDFSDTSEFLGTFDRPGVSNLSGVSLLMQEEIFRDNFIGDNPTSSVNIYGEDGTDSSLFSEHLLRITSDYTADWSVETESPSLPNPTVNVGWYFDLPIIGERLIENPLIRAGIFIAVTTIPDSSYCSGGGWSIVNEFDALDGSRPHKPTFDVTGEENGGENDGKILINESDKINLTPLIGGDEPEWVAATGILKPGGGILHLSESSIVELPGEAPKREKKILSSSVGKIQEIIELAPRRGIAFWREH